MNEILVVLLSAMLGYFFMRMDAIEKKLDKVENMILSLPKRSSDFGDRPEYDDC